jgi:succinate dehydrogenase / fumarate reductase, cytochrome b subunit
MNKKRPVNLDLRTIRFPITAIASILHRISGFILFFFIPVLLWMLQQSLHSAQGFSQLQHCLDNIFLKLILFGFLMALVYHLFAGIRHLFMDVGIGESLRGGCIAAKVVFAVTLIAIVLLGVWLW